jgi:hypothetical protein
VEVTLRRVLGDAAKHLYNEYERLEVSGPYIKQSNMKDRNTTPLGSFKNPYGLTGKLVTA